MNYRNYRPVLSSIQRFERKIPVRASRFGAPSSPLLVRFHSANCDDSKKFCVSTSGILAAYSFEAYNDPTCGKKAIGLDNTTLTYKSLNFIKHTFDGLLTVQINEIEIDLSGNPLVAKLQAAQKNPELAKLLPVEKPPEYFVNVIPHEEFVTDHPNPAFRVIDHLNVSLRVTEQTNKATIARPIASAYSKTGANDSIFIRNASSGAVELNIFDNALIGEDKMISRVYVPMEVLRQVQRGASHPAEVELPLYCDPEHALLAAEEVRPTSQPSDQAPASDEKASSFSRLTQWLSRQTTPKAAQQPKKNKSEMSLFEEKAKLFAIGKVRLSFAFHDFKRLADERIAALVQLPPPDKDHSLTTSLTASMLSWLEKEKLSKEYETVAYPVGAMPSAFSWAEVVQDIVQRHASTPAAAAAPSSLVSFLAKHGPMWQLCHLDNLDTDTQCTVWYHPRMPQLIIAFRGTDISRTKDLITDMQLLQRPLCPPEQVTQAQERYEQLAQCFQPVLTAAEAQEKFEHGNYSRDLEEVKVRLHEGFVTAYQSMQVALLQQLDFLTTRVSHEHMNQVYVTGHSLGGALATVCSFDLARLGGDRHITPCPQLLLHYKRYHERLVQTKQKSDAPKEPGSSAGPGHDDEGGVKHNLYSATQTVWEDTVRGWQSSLSSKMSSLPNLTALSSSAFSLSGIPTRQTIFPSSHSSAITTTSTTAITSTTSHSHVDNIFPLSYYLTRLQQVARSHSVNLTVYSYGTPRVGNVAFRQAYHDLLPLPGHCYRIVNQEDLIARLPLRITLTNSFPSKPTNELPGPADKAALMESSSANNSLTTAITANSLLQKLGFTNMLPGLPLSNISFPLDYCHVGQTVLVGNEQIDSILSTYLGNSSPQSANKWWVQGEGGLEVCPLDEDAVGLNTILFAGDSLSSYGLTGNLFTSFNFGGNPWTKMLGAGDAQSVKSDSSGASSTSNSLSLTPLFNVLREVFPTPMTGPSLLSSGSPSSSSNPLSVEQIRAMLSLIVDNLQGLEDVQRLKSALFAAYASAFPAFGLTPTVSQTKSQAQAKGSSESQLALGQLVEVLRKEQRVDTTLLVAYLRLIARQAGVQEEVIREWLEGQVGNVTRKLALVTNHLEPAYHQAILHSLQHNTNKQESTK